MITWQQHVDAVLKALPRDDEPSCCRLSDLAKQTGSPATVVEAVLIELANAGRIIVDKAMTDDPNHPADCRYFHAGRIFVLSAA